VILGLEQNLNFKYFFLNF